MSFWGDGSDGSKTISSSGVNVNDFTYLTGDETAGSTTISVNNSGAFSAGDEIMIIQMQNGAGNGIAGLFEFKEVDSVSTGSITLKNGLDNDFYSGSFDQVDAEVTQIIRVPQYTDLTVQSGASITPPHWNGYTGGIVIFRVDGNVQVDGTIEVDGAGFREGSAGGSDPANGYAGESYTGRGTQATYDGSSNPPNAGGGAGGSTGSCGGSDGAAGSYGTSGDDGVVAGGDADQALAGNTYGSNFPQKFFLGSGGGGASHSCGCSTSRGAPGAGAIIIYCQDITVNGAITADGANASNADREGGCGSGGSIYIKCSSVNTSTLSVAGGTGVMNGGDGRICIANNFQKTFSEAINVSDSLGKKAIIKELSESIGISDSLAKDIVKGFFAESISVSDELTQRHKIFEESINVSDSLESKSVIKFLTESISINDSLSKNIIKYFTESISVSDSQIKNIVKGFTEQMSLEDRLGNKYFNDKLIAEWSSKGVSKADWTEKTPPTDTTWTEKKPTKTDWKRKR